MNERLGKSLPYVLQTHKVPLVHGCPNALDSFDCQTWM